MILRVEKQNDPVVQTLKQREPRLYEALRKPDRLSVPIQEIHGFGVSGDVFVGESAFPPLVIQRSLQLVLLSLTLNTPPVGADFIADIRKRQSGASILKAPIIFPAGFDGVIERKEFGIDRFARNDVLLCDMLQIGSTTPGSMMSIHLFFEVLDE